MPTPIISDFPVGRCVRCTRPESRFFKARGQIVGHEEARLLSSGGARCARVLVQWPEYSDMMAYRRHSLMLLPPKMSELPARNVRTSAVHGFNVSIRTVTVPSR